MKRFVSARFGHESPEVMGAQDTPTECSVVVLQDGDICHNFKPTCEECVQRGLTVQLASGTICQHELRATIGLFHRTHVSCTSTLLLTCYVRDQA